MPSTLATTRPRRRRAAAQPARRDERRDAVDLEPARAPSGPARPAGARPRARRAAVATARAGSSTPSTSRPSRSGAALLEGLLDRELERRPTRPGSRSSCPPAGAARRRRSSPSSSTLPPWDSMYGRTLSSASAPAPRAAPGSRSWITAGSRPRVVGERAPRAAGAAASSSARHDPLEPGAVELHDRRRRAPRRSRASRVADLLEPRLQLLHAGDELSRRRRLGPPPPRPARSGCARPCAPCPSRRTCARRRAGTGRTSGPRA